MGGIAIIVAIIAVVLLAALAFGAYTLMGATKAVDNAVGNKSPERRPEHHRVEDETGAKIVGGDRG
jgi:flagellar basal body-associated protein FliL